MKKRQGPAPNTKPDSRRSTKPDPHDYSISATPSRFPFAGNIDEAYMTDVLEVDGFEVTYTDYPGFRFYAHRPIRPNAQPNHSSWKISEAETGLGLTEESVRPTKARAASAGLEVLRRNVGSDLVALRRRIDGGKLFVKAKRKQTEKRRRGRLRDSWSGAEEGRMDRGGQGQGRKGPAKRSVTHFGGHQTKEYVN